MTFDSDRSNYTGVAIIGEKNQTINFFPKKIGSSAGLKKEKIKNETENHGGNRKPTRRKIIIIENGEFEFIGFVLLSLIVFSLSLSSVCM